MANSNTYGHRTIYVKDHDLWGLAVTVARENNISVSTLIQEAMVNYLSPTSRAEIKLQKIRKILAED